MVSSQIVRAIGVAFFVAGLLIYIDIIFSEHNLNKLYLSGVESVTFTLYTGCMAQLNQQQIVAEILAAIGAGLLLSTTTIPHTHDD